LLSAIHFGPTAFCHIKNGEKAIGFPSNAGNSAQTTKSDQSDYSPEQLRRELRPVSTEPGFQSEPRIPWQLSLAYFPPSSLLVFEDIFNYLQNQETVKVITLTFGQEFGQKE
jgi:hypothetical protein